MKPRIGTLRELVREPGMPSQPSLQRLILSSADFPILDRGRKGRPYRFDLDAAAAYVREAWQDGRHRGSEAGTDQFDLFSQLDR